MLIGRQQLDDQRDTARVGEQAVFTARAASIRRVWPAFSPPSGAFTKLESTSTRDQSSGSAPRSLVRNTSWIRCHRPMLDHSEIRRGHVLYEQSKASVGKSSQAMPVLSTNSIAVNTTRASDGCRPPKGDGSHIGNRASISFHNASGNNLPAMTEVPP